MVESPILSHPQTFSSIGPAMPELNVALASVRPPDEAELALSDLSLPSSSARQGQPVVADSVDTFIATDSNMNLRSNMRPPSTPMELSFGETSIVASVVNHQRDDGRRDGLSQVLLRQNTQSTTKMMPQNGDQQPSDDEPTLFTTHSTILRPLPTRPLPLNSEHVGAPTTLPAVPLTMEPTKRIQVTEEPQYSVDHSRFNALHDWKVWAFIFFVLHLAFTSIFQHQQYFLPIWKSIPQRSSNQLSWYKQRLEKLGFDEKHEKEDFAGNRSDLVEITQEKIVKDENVANQELQARQGKIIYKRMLLEEYRKLKNIMQEAVSAYGPLLRDFNDQEDWDISNQVGGLNEKLSIQIRLLEEWEDALTQVELDMNALWLSLISTEKKKRMKVDTKSLKQSLQRLRKVSPVPVDESFLFDLVPILENHNIDEMPKTQSGRSVAGSTSNLYNTNLNLVEMTDFDRTKKSLMEYAIVTADKLVESIQSDDIIDSFIRSTVDTLKESMIPYHNVDKEQQINAPSLAHKYLSKDDILSIVNERLEMDRADITGKLDYASIRSGAKVIRSGPRKSSTSLSEDLPLLNRFMAASRLRFYGHKAEAALNPTYPRNALGQCWSFTKDSSKRKILLGREDKRSMKRDPDCGTYATLSVQLASPIRVKHIIVEHPIHILSSATTAIKNFRVYGYEDDHASNHHSWYLGSFKYDICKLDNIRV
jgi:hypothetical protein